MVVFCLFTGMCDGTGPGAHREATPLCDGEDPWRKSYIVLCALGHMAVGKPPQRRAFLLMLSPDLRERLRVAAQREAERVGEPISYQRIIVTLLQRALELDERDGKTQQC